MFNRAYRAFLARCSGGSVDGKCEYEGVSPDGGNDVHPLRTINGVRRGYTYSLSYNRKSIGDRIPKSLIWIMDDPGGNQCQNPQSAYETALSLENKAFSFSFIVSN